MRGSQLSIGTRAPARVPTRRRKALTDAELERRVESLAELDLAGVRWAWRDVTGHEPPAGLGREFLVRYLAYRLQAQVHGDLDRRFKRLLDRLADGDKSALSAPTGQGLNLKPGTIIVREYKGELHRVTVLVEGYAWNGKPFATLSGVARAITRANCNGYAFFGLKQKPPKEETVG